MSEPAPPDLVRDLLRADAYGAPAETPVSLRTTHASWVFLVGDQAWKVKRPVDFGFLDFRSVDDRRRFCQDEVRLNRRLAPDVYLGVEPVRWTGRGHVVGGQGEGRIVDWAVHMRRLPEDASAAAMLSRDALDAGHLSDLAALLARFFRGARSAPEMGGIAVLRRHLVENFAQVEPFVGDLIDPRTFEDVRTFHFGQLQSEGDRLAMRAAEGRIREGHGDLRLEHVYFLPEPGGRSRPTVIDCIEFNESFRCGDTAGEAAFVAMELEAARRPDLAAGFLARFAEASDDFGLYGVVDFYLSYRAWVRGKVAAFLTSDAAAGAELRALKRQEARRDFALARSFSGSPVDAPFLVAVGGVVGSGKSTLAAGLGRALAAPVVGSDRTRKALGGLAPTQRGGAALYRPENIEQTYAEVLRRGASVLAARRGVILDATFGERRRRRAAADLAREMGARFVFIEASCPDRELLRARLAARRSAASDSDATDAELDQLLAGYESLRPADPGPQLVVDTASGPAAAFAAALEGLRLTGVSPADERRCS